MRPKNFVSNILKKLAKEKGFSILLEPKYEGAGQIKFQNGKSIYFVDTRFNINPHGSVEVARNKDYTKFFLTELGYNTPIGKTVFSDELNNKIDARSTVEDGFLFIQQIGFPVILKPHNLSQGLYVTKVCSEEEYFQTANRILKVADILIIEKYYYYRDFRIVVFKGNVVCAYMRESLKIVGDGINTINNLIDLKQKDLEEQGRNVRIDRLDFRILQKLKRNNLHFDSVLEQSRVLFLLDNANLSEGGSMIDMTDVIHPEYKELAINITRDMGLRLCGVDIMTQDIAKPVLDYVVIEINSAPGLEHFASGSAENYKIAEQLYREILDTLEKETLWR